MVSKAEAAKKREEPFSLIFRRGKVCPQARILENELRKMFLPFNAPNLQMKKSNKLKDVEAVTGVLDLSHCLILSSSGHGTMLRAIKCPRGPTLHFRILKYRLSHDICAKRKTGASPRDLGEPALLVMSGFGKQSKKFNMTEIELSLVQSYFRNMFGAVDPTKLKPVQCRRVVLIYWDNENGLIRIRHFKIVFRQGSNVVHSIADAVKFGGSLGSKSSDSSITLASLMSSIRSSSVSGPSVRLDEIGPALDLRLEKVISGFDKGKELYVCPIRSEDEKVEDETKEVDEEEKEIESHPVKNKKSKMKKHPEKESSKKRKSKSEEPKKRRTKGGLKKKDGKRHSTAK
ncbi:Protein Peter Pan-like protein [Aduncisulcus paluster]|uniref:Protein Peter Pan-like protein n=1 Tax=Aduncisulcus paluster TaxID=2918883 RepID=A0ABQ5KL40_9EUKA|nr:Protein Peter Pan-like protein [Aduncisulcus paluster]